MRVGRLNQDHKPSKVYSSNTMTKEKNNIVEFLDTMHPRIGDVYEIDEDILVIAEHKDYKTATVRLLDPYAVYTSTKVMMSVTKFGSHNHIGNYEEMTSNLIW